MKTGKYCIIGAGAAGMAAFKTLVEEGFAVDCFEKTDRVGGHWHTDYEGLHLITPRDSSGFEDFPMPDDYPLYPSRDQVRDYMLAYARTFDLERQIEFNTTVADIAPLSARGETGWRVTLSNGQTRDYRGVLVANGHLWDPAIPELADEFSGRSMHSCQYKHVDETEGNVLVVGCGNSGCDIAADIAQARIEVDIAIRRGQLFQPKTLFGKPRAELTFVNALPPDQQNILMNQLIRISKGDAVQYPGLPDPETHDLDAQPPVVNDLLLYWIQHGRIKVVPGLENINERTVTFSDGTSRQYGTIIWATGFNVRLPFLDDRLLEWEDGVPLRTAATVLPNTVESLYFVGLCAPRGPQWPVYCQQSRLIAEMLRLREAGVDDLAMRFRESAHTENRIDIVKREWLEDLRRTWELVKAMNGQVSTFSSGSQPGITGESRP